jgi:hypothetical protein
LRDLANISFIFILLYTAIQTILGQATGKMKSAILGIVVAAVLINFSLFFTRVAIDTSNILAITFYTPIENCVVGLEEKDRGLATCLMSMMGLSSTFGAGGELLENTGEFSTAAIIAIGGAIFLTITFFIFTAIAIMLLIRYVNFIYLLIISPIGIAGSVIPGLSTYASAWRKKLIGECVFAPAYMLATWVILIVLQGGASLQTFSGGGTNAQKFSTLFESAATGSGGQMNVVINFIILIGLTLGSLLVAKNLANQSGSAGEKLISGGLKFAGMGAAGTGGFLGRRVGGRIGRNLSERDGLREAAAQGGVKGYAARMALKTSRAAGSGSWDLRSSNVMEKYNQGAKEVGGQTLDFGKAGGKGGFNKVVEESEKDEAKFAKSLGPSDRVKELAERELEAAKASGDMERQQNAQREVDRLKGVKREDVVARLKTDQEKERKDLETRKSSLQAEIDSTKIPEYKETKEKELEKIIAEEKKLKEEHEAKIKGAKAIDGAAKIRQEKYAETLESAPEWNIKLGALGSAKVPLPSTKRVGLFGKVSRESQNSATAIRKQAGGKSTAEEVLEKLKKEVKDDADKEPKVDKPAEETKPTDTPPTT